MLQLVQFWALKPSEAFKEVTAACAAGGPCFESQVGSRRRLKGILKEKGRKEMEVLKS